MIPNRTTHHNIDNINIRGVHYCQHILHLQDILHLSSKKVLWNNSISYWNSNFLKWIHIPRKREHQSEFSRWAGADSRLVKLVVMTNFFFNNQQHKITICLKEITPSFLGNSSKSTFLFIVYAKRENRPLQKTKFQVKFSSSAS